MSTQLDFDLEIRVENAGGYSVTVRAPSQASLPPQSFALPLDVSTLPSHRDIAEWVRQAQLTKLKPHPEIQKAKELGGALFKSLFTLEVLAIFRTSREVSQATAERLRVRLHLPSELTSIPWELLYDSTREQFLALAADISLVRYPHLSTPVAPLRLDGPLQVVIVLASPHDLSRIDLERESERVQVALKGPLERNQMNLDIIRGNGTLDQLRRRLDRPAHVLHILCHGDFDTNHDEGVLIFEDPLGDAEKISAERLRLELEKQRGQTRLVVLNSCLGAVASGTNPFGSVGAALMRGGVSAVIAMQFEIPVDTAAELARILYADLADGKAVDVALAEARRNLFGFDSFRLDWAIPVLFSRVSDGVLFKGTMRSNTSAILLPVPEDNRELLQARAAFRKKYWQDAVENYQSLSGTYELPQSDKEQLSQAQLRLRRANAVAAEREGDWKKAENLWALISESQPNDPDVQTSLASARSERLLAAQVQEALAYTQLPDWEAVLMVLDQIEQERPDYQPSNEDLPALRQHAVRWVTYSRAEKLAEEAQWDKVIEELNKVSIDRSTTPELLHKISALRARAEAWMLMRDVEGYARRSRWSLVKPLLNDIEKREVHDIALKDAIEKWNAQAELEIELLESKRAAELSERLLNWFSAAKYWEDFVAKRPDDLYAQEHLRLARMRQTLDSLVEEAEKSARAGKWNAAHSLLMKLETERPDYTHPSIDIQTLRRSVLVRRSYQSALGMANREDWKGVLREIERIPKDMLDESCLLLVHRANVSIAYNDAKLVYKRGDWSSVVDLLGAYRSSDILTKDGLSLFWQAYAKDLYKESKDQRKSTPWLDIKGVLKNVDKSLLDEDSKKLYDISITEIDFDNAIKLSASGDIYGAMEIIAGSVALQNDKIKYDLIQKEYAVNIGKILRDAEVRGDGFQMLKILNSIPSGLNENDTFILRNAVIRSVIVYIEDSIDKKRWATASCMLNEMKEIGVTDAVWSHLEEKMKLKNSDNMFILGIEAYIIKSYSDSTYYFTEYVKDNNMDSYAQLCLCSASKNPYIKIKTILNMRKIHNSSPVVEYLIKNFSIVYWLTDYRSKLAMYWNEHNIGIRILDYGIYLRDKSFAFLSWLFWIIYRPVILLLMYILGFLINILYKILNEPYYFMTLVVVLVILLISYISPPKEMILPEGISDSTPVIETVNPLPNSSLIDIFRQSGQTTQTDVAASAIEEVKNGTMLDMDEWLFTVRQSEADKVEIDRIGDFLPNGKFIKVIVGIKNMADKGRRFPSELLRLIDNRNRSYYVLSNVSSYYAMDDTYKGMSIDQVIMNDNMIHYVVLIYDVQNDISKLVLTTSQKLDFGWTIVDR
jgi:hypothetical protein